MRGKSQARSNKLYETMGKRTIDKVSKISKTKKQHKQQRTPKKNIIYSQSQEHLDLIQSLIRIFYKRADEREKQLLNQFMKSMQREKKIKHILSKNQDRHHDLKEMVQHLREEQKTLIEKLKQQTENDDENDLKEQIWKLYAYIFNCKKKDSIVKYPLDALTQIRKKIDEEKHVLHLSFQIIERLHSCRNQEKEEEQTRQFSQMIDDLEEGVCEIGEVMRLKEENGELKKKNLQLAKENLQKYKEMKKIEEQFQFLVQEKLHLTNRLQLTEKKVDRLKLDKVKSKEKYEEKFSLLADDVFDLQNTLHRFNESWKNESSHFMSQMVKKGSEYELLKEQEKEKEYRQQLGYITRAHEHEMERVSREFEQLICRLEEEVTEKQMEINRYLKMVKQLKEEERNEKKGWEEIQTSLEMENSKMAEQNEQKEKSMEELRKRIQLLDEQVKGKSQEYESLQSQIKSECGMLLELKQKQIKTKEHTIEKLMMKIQDIQQQYYILFQSHQANLHQLDKCQQAVAHFQENFMYRTCQFQQKIVEKCIQTEKNVEAIIKRVLKEEGRNERVRTQLQKVKESAAELRLMQEQLKKNSLKICMNEDIKMAIANRQEFEEKEEGEKQSYYQILEQLLEQFCFNHLNLDWNRKLKGISTLLRDKVLKYRSKIGEMQEIMLKGREDNIKLSQELKWMKQSQQTQEIKQNQQKSTEEEFPAVLTASISFQDSSNESVNLSDVLNQSDICIEIVALRNQIDFLIEQNKKLRKKLQPDSFTDEQLIFDI